MKKLLLISTLLLFVLPGTAQATTMQDPDDVGPGMLDIKSASVGHTTVDGDGVLALTVESYEPFGCADLAGTKHSGRSLAFVIDYPSTPRTHDLRIRVRCTDSGVYWWRARTVEGRHIAQRNVALRPTDTTLTVVFTQDWYGAENGELPARWKVVSTRWITSTTAEVDAAPDTGWAVFDPQS
jgi:hypothetical protein